jgi:predicted GNAT family acetyltransferase
VPIRPTLSSRRNAPRSRRNALRSRRNALRSRRTVLRRRRARHNPLESRLRDSNLELSNIANRSKLSNRDKPRLRHGLHRSRRPRRAPQSIPRSIKTSMSIINHDRIAHQFTSMVDNHLAVLDYTLTDHVMSITHTRVPQAIGGRGIAAELMRAAVNAARVGGWTVNPVCSYAVDYMRKHPEDPHKQHVDDLLDEALDESFPASDSPSVGGSS